MRLTGIAVALALAGCAGSTASLAPVEADLPRCSGANPGYLVAVRSMYSDRLDAGVLAVVEAGRPCFVDDDAAYLRSTPATLNCKVLAKGARLKLAWPTSRAELTFPEEPFSNEANTCVGHPTPPAGAAGGHLLAVKGLPTEPVHRVEVAAADVRAATLEAVSQRSGGVLTSARFAIQVEVSSYRFRSELFRVAEVSLTPLPGCKHAACRWGAGLATDGKHAAVVIFREKANGAVRPVFVRARVVDREDAGPPFGLVSFAGFVAPLGAREPWAVLLWDGGPEWEFELVVPHSDEWRSALFGAASTTI